MVFMGSKRKYCKYIVPILQQYIKDNNIENFYDVFCGGANLTDKIDCRNVYANDLSPTLIALHKQAQEDFSKIPKNGNREYWDQAYSEYKRLKDFPIEFWRIETTIPLYLIGAIEWYSSFANGGFPRGYAKPTESRNYYQEAYRNHQKQSQEPRYQSIKFTNHDYQNLTFNNNSLIYCDPPYKSTKPYSINPKFSHEDFYNWCRETSKSYPIFISEQSMPDDFKVVWSKDDVTRTCGLDNNFKACEKLFFIDNRQK